MHPPDRFVPKESVRVSASNRKKPEGKAGHHRDHHAGKSEYRVGCFPLLVCFNIRGLCYASGPAENDGEETDDIPVIYEM